MPSHASTAAKVRSASAEFAASYRTMHLCSLAHPEIVLPYAGHAECGAVACLSLIANEPELTTCLACLRALISRNLERKAAERRAAWPDIPVLTPLTARPVDLNPAAWGEDASGEDDDPRPSR